MYLYVFICICIVHCFVRYFHSHNHMVETEALFRQKEVLGPLCSGPETRIILFFTITVKCLVNTCSYFSDVSNVQEISF